MRWVDPHVHAGPCIVDRVQDAPIIVGEAREAGYAGLVLKSPGFETATLAALACTLEGPAVAGGIVLSHVNGGVNPAAVEAMFEVRDAGGARAGRVVWMPSRDAEDHLSAFPRPGASPVRLWDSDRQPMPALLEVLDLIASYDGVLATSHLAYDQARRLIEVASSRGIERIVVTHAEMEPVSLTPDEQRELAKLGAMIEHAYAAVLVGPQAHAEILRDRRPCTVAEIVEGIRATGAGASMVATDFGGLSFGRPVAGFLELIGLLQEHGVGDSDLELLASRNALDLFGWS